MVKRSKLVSVIIPTKNRKKMLLQTLKSVLFQKYKNLQVIIHDNNSLDNTYEYIKYLLKDKRIEYYNTKKDIPMWDNWNLAFGYVRGDYFLKMHQMILYKSKHHSRGYLLFLKCILYHPYCLQPLAGRG